MEDNSKNQPSTNKNKKLITRVIIIAVILVAVVVIGKKVLYALRHEETDNAQIEMRLTPILSRASGYVDKIFVNDYSPVHKGQLLMVIDSSELELQLEEMQADYNQALADIENAKASLVNAGASLSSSKGNVDVIALRKEKATSDFNRDKNLFEANAITRKQFDDSKSNFDITMRQLQNGELDVRVADTRLNILRSQLSKAEANAQLKKAKIDQQKLKITYCRVFATSDGKVGKRDVDEGQFVQAGTPLFTLVNDQNMWVVANFKENQIKNIRVGQEVAIKVDGFPKLDVRGKVITLSEATGARFSLLPPDDATGNFVKVAQRIPIRIEILDEAKYKDILRAGMSVDVAVPIL